jgi:hypothetical protein
MKNLFLLPTDKPSRLYFDIVVKELLLQNRVNVNPTSFPIEKRHIYITNSEEIKEGDWYVSIDENIRQSTAVWDTTIYDKCPNKKIILTTDQDLIKDGVQSIDDEFLEWLINNPTCEYVEVIPYLKSITNPITNEDYPIVQYRHFDLNKMICKYKYKIIIPITSQQIIDEDFAGGLDMGQIYAKQEAKQDRTCSNNCSVICGECQIFEFRPMSVLKWLLGYIEELNKKGYKFVPSSNKEIVEHVTQMEKDNMINFLKSVFQQDNFNYEKAYNEFINKKRV